MAYTISGVSQSFNSISKQISRYEFTTGIRKTNEDCFFDVRGKLNSLGRLNFIGKSDTIFLLESYNVENGDFYGRIWNAYDKVEYIYNNEKFDFNVNQIFTDYTCKLIINWDTTSIRHEEKINSLLTNPLNIYATRVIKIKDGFKIDSILFKEFFSLSRDR